MCERCVSNLPLNAAECTLNALVYSGGWLAGEVQAHHSRLPRSITVCQNISQCFTHSLQPANWSLAPGSA